MDTAKTSPLINGLLPQMPDTDPEETKEWIESFDGLMETGGANRARYLMLSMLDHAAKQGVNVPRSYVTDYVNTISSENEAFFPGDEEVERSYRRWIRWNAAVQVTRAQRDGVHVGGHISSYASVSTLYEVGFNHFFRGKEHPGGGDHIFFQGHASPGVYARAFVEGRLTEEQMDGFRQEKSTAHGLPSYPHPRMLPDFWEYPTVSMGLGPAEAIYQAWFDRYLQLRGIKDTSQQHVWAFLGDGEMDEPESRGMLQLAGQQALDNLTFVVNCNLQRLDGPVRGNGKIIQELETYFRGAGWNVIKVIWGRGWDPLLAADKDNALLHIMNECLDGDYQSFRANDGAYIREHFFNRDPRAAALVQNWTDEDIWALRRGGHDYRKVYAAYHQAVNHTGQPTVILAHTIKGFSLGGSFEGRNATHQMKKVDLDNLKLLRDRLQIPITDEQLEANPQMPPYYRPDPSHPSLQYMLERRKRLGGFLPSRPWKNGELPMPADKHFDLFKKGSGNQPVASTMALVRLVKDLIKDPLIGKYFVPIIPDEARTFGLEAIFPSAKIFNTLGQNYTAVDAKMMLAYKESTDGQIMHTGINEAGSTALFQVAGSSYATNNQPMIPFYITYSMFGFQRTADQFWAAGDQMTRGFFIGATAGRTTLTGEGTQHMDGHSPVIAATNAAAVIWDPGYAYEIAHIMRDGLHRMYGPTDANGNAADGRDRNVFYYLTVYNEPMPQPAEPANLDVEGLLKGIYLLDPAAGTGPQVQLLASGVSLPWARKARALLAQDWGVSAAVWSVTSWSELRRDGLAADRHNFLHPEGPRQEAYLSRKFAGINTPFIATSDYDHLVPDMIRPWVPGAYCVLGADGFGFSDTRPAARRFFNIDAESMVAKALQMLAQRGEVDPSCVAQAISRYNLLDPKSLFGQQH